MLILILIVCIAIAIIGTIVANIFGNGMVGGTATVFVVSSIVVGGFTFLIIVGLFISLIEYSSIDDKVVMYQQENKKIETQIDELVKNYMKYENNTFKEFKTESSVAIVSLYPELKSDTLVKSQIETYTKNNNKIKGLKEKKIMRSVYRWWLYFGK